MIDYKTFMSLYARNHNCPECERRWRLLLNNEARYWWPQI